MHWTLKALIQNAVACLPSSLSYAVYYRLQRHFGGLTTINPVGKLRAAVETWQHAQDPVGAVFLEVGTGRAPMVQITHWLMGAERVITVDLNPYLADAVLRDSPVYLIDHDEEIVSLLGRRLVSPRWSALLDDALWRAIASNRYMYMNRLRHDAMLTLFQRAGHRSLSATPEVDSVAESVLRNGFKLAEPYRSMPQDILAITSAWIVSTPAERKRELGRHSCLPAR